MKPDRLLLFASLILMFVSGCGSIESRPNEVLSSDRLLVLNKGSQQIRQLAPSFQTRMTYPYILTGDLSSAELEQWKKRIQRTQYALKKRFFKHDPSQLITVWLFKNEASYTRYNQKFWNLTPTTPYGYFNPPNRRMVMNIGSGGGTLTHELVHTYINENFPKSPLWFHEGLASLYERSRYDYNGNIYGVNNWRLSGLQQALKAGSAGNLAMLMRGGDEAFYGVNQGLNYAKARYLMFYLQSRGLLALYYQTYSTNIDSDQSGITSLLKVTGFSDMAALERAWKRFVLNQRY